MDINLPDIRVWVKGLIVACPFNTPLADCSAKDIRKLPLAEGVKVVNAMSIEQLEAIIYHHKKCLKMREQ